MDSNDRRRGGGAGWDGAPGCLEVEALLVPYLDGEATREEAGAVEDHVALCPRCARSLELHRRVGEALRALACGEALGGEALGGETRGGEALAAGLAGRARLEARRRSRSARRLWTGLAAAALLLASSLVILKPWAGGRGDAPPAEDLLGSLDVLEVFQEEGLEPTDELVRLLLQEADEDSEPWGDGVLDPSVFKYVLEEELSEENL